MVAAIRIALGLLLLAEAAQANLQLTPTEAAQDCDGVKIPYLSFPDGQARVSYGPPRGWHYSRSGDRFVLRPPQNASAEAEIRVIPISQPQVFDEVTTKKLTTSALAMLPAGATNTAVISEEKDPIVIERKGTFLVVMQYESYGVAYTRSLMFLNRDNEQMQFQLTAPRANFPQLQKAFMASHYSWQHL